MTHHNTLFPVDYLIRDTLFVIILILKPAPVMCWIVVSKLIAWLVAACIVPSLIVHKAWVFLSGFQYRLWSRLMINSAIGPSSNIFTVPLIYSWRKALGCQLPLCIYSLQHICTRQHHCNKRHFGRVCHVFCYVLSSWSAICTYACLNDLSYFSLETQIS